MGMETYKKASMIVVIDSLIAAFGLACALIVFSAPTAMVDMVIGEENFSTTANLQEERDYIETVLRLSGAIFVTFLAFNFLLIMMLWTGTKNRSVNKLRTWVIANIFITGFLIFETLLIGGYDQVGKFMAKIPNLLLIIYRIFSIRIIWHFMNQVKGDGRARDLAQIKISTSKDPDPEIVEGMIKNLD